MVIIRIRIIACIYIAPFKRPKDALHMSVRTEQKRKEEKVISTKQDRNKKQGRALTEARGLNEQVVLEEFSFDWIK